VNEAPYRPNMGCFSEFALVKAVMALEDLGSGVSSASALSAGEDSAPETSEKRSWSKGLRGVVKDGFRNGGAGVEEAVMKELWGRDSNPPADS